MSMYPDMNSVSARLHERAQHVMPGGNTRHTVFISPYPIYAVSGAGCRVTDADGNTYIDFMSNASATIHGHAHPEIVAALRDQVGKLASVCLPTDLEVRLAEMICERLPGVEQVRFCNSGSEAVMFALKAARAYTGRPKIAKVEGAYHGAYDAAEASMDPTTENWGSAKHPEPVGHSAGTPQNTLADVVVLPFNDVEATRAILNAHAGELAAVLLDPLVSRMSFTPATPEYLRMVREFCDTAGTVLIFDEVFSFRMGYHGAQGEVGVTPDLTALGKVIGGGLPVGAIGGKREFMSVFDHRNGHPKAPHGGTFNGNPLTMVAGIKALELLTRDAHAELRRLGDKARKGLNEAFRIADVDGQARGQSSMISILLSSASFHDYRGFAAAAATSKGFQTIHRHLINHGILTLASGGTFLSTPMGDSEIDHLTQTFLDALQALKAKRAA
jgi:glutamate-1-semialdehyde 2,1-aminomutase